MSVPWSSSASVGISRSVAIAAVIFTRWVLRWALPSADQACQGRTGLIAVDGGRSGTRVRTRPGTVPPL
jgi:hypothetical protein